MSKSAAGMTGREQVFHVLVPSDVEAYAAPFADLLSGLEWGLQQLGHRCVNGGLNDNRDARKLILCPHLLSPDGLAGLDASTILYNLEQITPASPMPPSRLWSLRHWTRWDFSPRNIGRWSDQGLNVGYLPIGWHPGLERFSPLPRRDIDILFFGILNPRRAAVLERLAQAGFKLEVRRQLFGAERDELVARARIVLNIHYYPTGLLETLRLSYLLANGCAVVSERSPRTEVPVEYEAALRWATYDKIVEACAALLADDAECARQAAAGQAAIRTLPIPALLTKVLAECPA